jgi:hypothetical protein
MSETPTAGSRPIVRAVPNGDAMFFLALGFVVVALAVAIMLRY